jgi:hypothetical protein
METNITTITTNNHMAIIQIQVGKHIIDDIFLDGSFGVNIISKQLKNKVGLPEPKSIPYDL